MSTPLPHLFPCLHQFLDRPRAGEMSRPDATDHVCALVEILDNRLAHHREAALQLRQIFPAEHFVRRSGTARHDRGWYHFRLLFAFMIISSTMGRQTGQKRSESSTMRCLDSVHGKVPVLRAGGETYLWMPAASGGESVWRHALTRGTSRSNARKRIALKVGVSQSSAPQLAKAASSNDLYHSSTPQKNWIN